MALDITCLMYRLHCNSLASSPHMGTTVEETDQAKMIAPQILCFRFLVKPNGPGQLNLIEE